MSLVKTEITIRNGSDIVRARDGTIKEPEIRQMTVDAMVNHKLSRVSGDVNRTAAQRAAADTGAWTLVIPEAVSEQLGLDITGSEPGSLADGRKSNYNTASPVEVRWKNRRALCDALILPGAEDILLGAIPLEAMDLTVNPRREEVVGKHGDVVLHLV